MTNDSRPKQVAAFLFCSGLCALIYQTVWLREFRLIFGASTPASAAVLGVFMGGLGLGSAVLGRRAEAARKPLLYYAHLELLIAFSAALTPGLVWLVRQVYAATGGTMVIGHTLGTVVRLLLAALVLIVPTFLMGGTLPAASRAALSDRDIGRRSLALLYGCNTLGAVLGASLSTFWLVEQLGNRSTLWLACVLNLLVALWAREAGRRMPEVVEASGTNESEEAQSAGASWRFVAVAAGLVGFAFMLMELVWYRMLSPILGGSTFTFGIILIVALLGIGLGGAAYSARSAEKPAVLGGFALSCGWEALFVALPFALGDRLALLSLMLRHLGALGFGGQIFGWFVVTMIVVLPASIVAGYQFPMLIALLGRGRAGVARHTGQAYAANTLGAIVGSIAGGFGLLPLLGALGVWKAVTIVLALLAVAAAFQDLKRHARPALSSLAVSAIAVAMLFATGPTAAWRHSGIGAGRADSPSPNQIYLHNLCSKIQRATVWEADGVESSVALIANAAYAFAVNGKIDGNSRYDAGTQVMSGLTGALLHGGVKHSMVIGLGTGSTAGWLGKVPEMERVDVVELEPAILEVARRCAAVNGHVLENPKVHMHIGDAREVLLATPERYDLIFSEPSNPYRAGIASLFTQDFYQAVEHRLNPGGVFLQWVQAYDVDGEAVRTVYATLGTVFPCVQTWRTQANDLILVATREPLSLDAETLRARVATEPYHTALQNVWRVDSLEGVLAHFLGNEKFARRVVESGQEIATDDRNTLEFGFARGVGRSKLVNLPNEMVTFAKTEQINRPLDLKGEVDWNRVDREEVSFDALYLTNTTLQTNESAERKKWRAFFDTYNAGEPSKALRLFRSASLESRGLMEIDVLAEICALTNDAQAPAVIDRLAQTRPNDAEAMRGVLYATQGKHAEAADALIKAFVGWRTDPWARSELGHTAIGAAQAVARKCGDVALAKRLFDALNEPFAVENLRELRYDALVSIAPATDRAANNPQLLAAMKLFGNEPDWRLDFLKERAVIYRNMKDPMFERAASDLVKYLDLEAVRFDTGLSRPASEPEKVKVAQHEEKPAAPANQPAVQRNQ